MDNGPAAKKRKLGNANASVAPQESFTEVLERLRDGASANNTGA